MSTSTPTPFNAPPALINGAANDSLRFSKVGDRGEDGAEGEDELEADDALLGGRALFATGEVGGVGVFGCCEGGEPADGAATLTDEATDVEVATVRTRFDRASDEDDDEKPKPSAVNFVRAPVTSSVVPAGFAAEDVASELDARTRDL